MLLFFLNLSLILSLTAWPFGKSDSVPASGAPLKKTAYSLPSQPDEYAFIKILISSGTPEVTVSAKGPYHILDDRGRTVFKASNITSARVKANGDITQIGVQPFHSNPVILVSGGEGIKIGNAVYRHAIEFWREANGKLMAINDIPIEDYLKGVLPSEVNPKWPAESLRAQAIASRTYALFKMIENRSQRYHLSKDVLSQVYGGKGQEHTLSNHAVEMTQGQIMTHEGKVFPAYFHSTCGGHTTRAEFIWPVEPHPALEGVECNFCWQSKHYRWAVDMPAAEIEKKLKAKRVQAAGLKNITMENKDATGRARFIGIETAAGKTKIHSNDFRIWVDPMKFKSTWIQSIEKKGGIFSFKGRGWGHGVGLCQYGIKQLGEMGYDAGKILRYYYPGSQITQYWVEQPKSLENSFRNFVGLIKDSLDLE
jgi:stage II sporulation protein D